MKASILAILIGLCGISASCQSTPYLGLALPPKGGQNWNVPMNSNFTILDSYLGGATAFPHALQTSITGNAVNLKGGALGSIPFQNAPNQTLFLPGNTTTITKFLCQTGTGTSSAPPVWCTAAAGSVSSFTAPAVSWPSWLVPTVSNPTGAVILTVAASPIPNAALQNSAFTLGSTSISLGGTATAVTGLTIDGVSPATMAFLDATSSIQTQLNGKAGVGGVVSSINGTPGAFTFSFSGGAGSCVGTNCTFTGTGTATTVTVNGGSGLLSLNINASAPVADANNLALTPKISGANMIIEAPYGSASQFGVLQCGTGLTCTGGVASTTASLSGMTATQLAVAGSGTTITGSIAIGNTGNDIPQLSSGLLNPSVIPNNTANTTGTSGGLLGGAVGSAPYQSAANTTVFIASPTTSGHQFFFGWAPSGSAIAPTAQDLGTYLGTNVTASSPIVATPSTLGVQLSCPTCGTAGGGTSVGVNGGSTLGSLNINAISPVADASFLALTPKISAADVIVEAPYGSASQIGVLQCGTGLSCSGGVASTTSSISGMTTGQIAIAGSASTITSSIAIGNTGSSIPQLSSGLLSASIIPNNAANTTGFAAGLAGGALGSIAYQSAANTTLFVAGATTSGHTFVLAEQPSGSLIAPTLMDLGTYLGANVTATSPIVATPTVLGTVLSCPTCSTGGSVTNFIANAGSWPTWLVPTVTLSTTTPTLAVAASPIPNAALANASITINSQTCTLGSTCTIPTGVSSVTINGGSALGTANFNNTLPAAQANFINATWQNSGNNVSVEVPFGSASQFGVLQCGSGTSCSGGVISAVASGVPYPAGSGIPQVVTGASWGSTYNASNTIPANFLAAIPLSGLATEAANTVVGNFTGSTAAPTANVLSTCAVLKYTAGTGFGCATGIGSVTSVALTMPGIFAVSGSPVTSSGTLGVTLTSQTQNQAWMSPSGSSGPPTFRAIVQADLPSTSAQSICHGTLALSTAAIAAGSHTLNTATCTGAAVGDNVQVDWNSATGPDGITGYDAQLGYTLILNKWISATNTVTVEQVNSTNNPASITPQAVTVSYRVTR